MKIFNKCSAATKHPHALSLVGTARRAVRAAFSGANRGVNDTLVVTHSTRALPCRRRNHGFTLPECLVYIGTLAVVLGIGSAALYRCWDDNLAISHNADDIIRTLKAGEAWRADVRSATGSIKAITNASGQSIVIPRGTNELTYSFSAGEVRKQISKNAPWIPVLSRVKSSQMQSDPRDHAAAWRWEVALEPRRKHAHLRPLFTFEAVTGNPLVQ